jgi:glycerol kinase
MAWDNTRPVPWQRLIREWLIYAAIMTAVFLVIFNDGNTIGEVRLSAQDTQGVADTTGCISVHRRRPAVRSTASCTDQPHRRRRQPTSGQEEPTALTTLLGVTKCVIAIDAGTTGVRSRAVFTDDSPTVASYREFTQHYPQPGWVEHDATEIWDAVVATLNEVISEVGRDIVAAIGITNQRETVLAWNRSTGVPYGSAIVWQDRRTASRCDELTAAGHLDLVRERTGLVLDPYFSGTKFEWLLSERDIPVDDDLALGTIDAWLIWNLTGGQVFATDVTNASRTMLCDIGTRTWDPELCALLNVPMSALPTIVASSGRIGVTSERCGVPAAIPISGVAGDQQAALFGQACVQPGMAKNTYGTGSFVLLNVGETCPPPTEGMLTTVAWTLADGTTHYALEGAIFVTGAAIQWLRDGLNIIDEAAQAGPLAQSVDDTGGVYFVPALAGLGSPWWDPYARGTIVGITRGTGRAEITRAAVESMAYQTRDVVDAMVAASGTALKELRVDGGASVMDFLCQIQSDQLGVEVLRPVDQETTALGAAFLAGLAEGVWASPEEVLAQWTLDASFSPAEDRVAADAQHHQWLRAVERSRGWAD